MCVCVCVCVYRVVAIASQAITGSLLPTLPLLRLQLRLQLQLLLERFALETSAKLARTESHRDNVCESQGETTPGKCLSLSLSLSLYISLSIYIYTHSVTSS